LHDLKDTGAEKLQTSAEKLSEKYNDLKDAVRDKVEETKDNLKEKWQDLKHSGSQKLHDLKDSGSEKFSELKDTVYQKTQEARSDLNHEELKLEKKGWGILEWFRDQLGALLLTTCLLILPLLFLYNYPKLKVPKIEKVTTETVTIEVKKQPNMDSIPPVPISVPLE